jgi:hypothetical protein
MIDGSSMLFFASSGSHFRHQSYQLPLLINHHQPQVMYLLGDTDPIIYMTGLVQLFAGLSHSEVVTSRHSSFSQKVPNARTKFPSLPSFVKKGAALG